MPKETIIINQEKPTKNLLTKIFVAFAILAMVAIIVCVLIYAYYVNETERKLFLDNNEVLSLTIKKGSSVNDIGKYLFDQKLIKYPEVLKVYMYLNPQKSIQAGYYRISEKDLNLIKLVDIFQTGSFERKLTFIEGWRVEEYVDYLKVQMGEDFADKFAESKFVREGYMFPDTYIVEEDYAPDDLASWMKNNFDKKFTTELVEKAALSGLTKEQVVILASLLEREMNIKKDRPIVAGILIKRLRNQWALQVDASVQYAKGYSGNWWPVVTREDLRKIDSPYNTYTNKGLPVGSISNPGLNSIESVVNYVDSPYWFYITGKDGVTHYSETLEGHNQKVQRYL